MEDRAIIDLYHRRSQRAIAESQKKYGPYCFTVAQNILADAGESEETVSDTWLRAWNAMPPAWPAHLGAFLAKITRNLALHRWEARQAEKRGGGQTALVLEELAEVLAGDADPARAVEAKELAAFINAFIKSLPRREGDLFLRRYFFTEELAAIARRYGMRENHVSVTLHRTRTRLREALRKEGYIHD